MKKLNSICYVCMYCHTKHVKSNTVGSIFYEKIILLWNKQNIANIYYTEAMILYDYIIVLYTLYVHYKTHTTQYSQSCSTHSMPRMLLFHFVIKNENINFDCNLIPVLLNTMNAMIMSGFFVDGKIFFVQLHHILNNTSFTNKKYYK